MKRQARLGRAGHGAAGQGKAIQQRRWGLTTPTGTTHTFEDLFNQAIREVADGR